MFNKSTIENKMNVDIAISNDMVNAIELWKQIHENKSPWVDKKTVFSMNLGQGIASTFAKLVTIEFKSEIKNNDFLNEQYQVAIDNIRNYTQFACAEGGVIFKPYLNNGKISVDFVKADEFYPVAFKDNQMTACIFLDTKTIGDNVYTKVEYHSLVNTDYTIMNKLFKKKSYNGYVGADQSLGNEVLLTEVEEWAQLAPMGTLKNVEKPLFAYFKMPFANTIDSNSPLGVSVFAPISDDILKKADEQYSRIDWEYKGSELAIDVDITTIKKDEHGNEILPVGKERLFRKLDIDGTDETKNYNVFSPNIRDISLYNGLQHQLRTIEFLIGLAYGTISDPNTIDKTATEIEMNKQNSFQTVSDMQKSQKSALKTLAYGMAYWGMLAKLPVKPIDVEKDIEFNYGDSIITNKDDMLMGMAADVASGLLRGELYIAKKYGVSEEVAKTMMPDTSTLVKPSLFDNKQ